MLARFNYHVRDNLIKKKVGVHGYVIRDGKGLIRDNLVSVTNWVKTLFSYFNADEAIDKIQKGINWNPGNKYWGLTPNEIKKMWVKNGSDASNKGKALHSGIEWFMNLKPKDSPLSLMGIYTHKDLLEVYDPKLLPKNVPLKEWGQFLQFVKDYPHLRPYRVEWMVFDEDRNSAGCIDMVYKNPDETLAVYDWKCIKEMNIAENWGKYALPPYLSHIPDTNYWHYAFQLNKYKNILERKYSEKVADMYLLRFHENIDNYEMFEVVDLQVEIEELHRESLTG